MRHLHTIQASALALATAAIAASACGNAQSIENIRPGTEVTLQLDNGEIVNGRVMNVEPETVTVEQAGTARPHTIDRAAIVAVDQPQAAEARSLSDRLFSREPAFDDVEVPAGTIITARLETSLASNVSHAEDIVRATMLAPLVLDGREILPEGAAFIGNVASAEPAGKVKGRATLRFAFDRVTTGTATYEVASAPFVYVADSTKKEDAAKIGVGAAAGTVVGALAGGKRGAAVGAAIGGGAGTAVVLATAGDEVHLQAGTKLEVQLTQPWTLRLPRHDS